MLTKVLQIFPLCISDFLLPPLHHKNTAPAGLAGCLFTSALLRSNTSSLLSSGSSAVKCCLTPREPEQTAPRSSPAPARAPGLAEEARQASRREAAVIQGFSP